LCREKKQIADGEGCAEKRKEWQTTRIVQRKEKNFRWGGVLFKTQMNSTMLQSCISLSDMVEFLSFSDDLVPPFNFLKTNPFPSNLSSIKSLILALFNSVLGPKKFLQTGP
jgi:hypothetical protein